MIFDLKQTPHVFDARLGGSCRFSPVYRKDQHNKNGRTQKGDEMSMEQKEEGSARGL